MHEMTRALFAEAASPTHCTKRQLHDQLQPLGAAMHAARMQHAEYRNHLTELELSDHDPAINGKLAMMHTTLDAMDAELTTVTQHFRRLIQSTDQWERYAREAEKDVTQWEADQEAKAADQRAPDQQAALELAFVAGTLPEEDRRAVPAVPAVPVR